MREVCSKVSTQLVSLFKLLQMKCMVKINVKVVDWHAGWLAIPAVLFLNICLFVNLPSFTCYCYVDSVSMLMKPFFRVRGMVVPFEK